MGSKEVYKKQFSKKSSLHKAIIFVLMLFLCVTNQNCSSGFKVSPDASNSSLSTQDCDLPWGGILNDGGQVMAYQSGSVPQGQSCASQTRICEHGTLSGSYTFQNCAVQAPNSCTLPWGGTIDDGQSATAFLAGSVPFGQTCASQTRNCSNGTLSGTYTFQTCMVQAPANCTLDGVTVQHGQSRNFYNSVSVPFGQTCSSISRTCNNGTLSGDNSYNHASCMVQGAVACTLPWGGTIPSGQSVTAYQSASVPNGQTCASQTRNCNNGVLNGTYQFQTCTVQGSGSGVLSFQSGFSASGPSGSLYFSVQMVDFTGDGNSDLMIMDHNSASNNFYWKGDGHGNFIQLDNSAYGSSSGQLSDNDARGSLWSWIVDFNGDGKLDLWWDDVSPSSLRFNDGTGHFNEYAMNAYGSVIDRVRGMWDYNQDGVLDVVDKQGKIYDGRDIINRNLTHPTLLGDYHCDPAEFYEIPHCYSDYGEVNGGTNILHLATLKRADFDGDGQKDVVVDVGASFASNQIRLYKNNNSTLTRVGSFPISMSETYGNYSNIAVADFNNDGKPDIAVAGCSSGATYQIFLNQGNFVFTHAYDFSDGGGDGRPTIAVGDFDNDGKIDVAVISGNGVHVYKNTSN